PGEPGGQMFIVMACYEGETLKLRIEKGKLKIEEAIDYTIQIARGLQKAHEKGIIHRDIKSANIIITDDGEAKILDFGLAKLAGQAQLTKDTSTLGTVAYMSPEQVSGKEVDQRSDIWSLGVVLYEMLTGQPPFKGDYEQAVMYAILNEEPKTLDNVQSELQDIVKKTLIKNPDERYASTAELLQNLSSIQENIKNNTSRKKLTKTKNTKSRTIIISSVVIFILIATFFSILFFPSSEPEASIKSLAVLPFLNIKEDPETNFLGFALADQIIGKLNYLQNINVRASSSVREYENKKVNPQQVGNALKVDFILTGNYLVENKNIRLNVELVETKSNNLIWRGDRIEVNYENTFTLQDIVSQKIIDRLKIQFAQDEQDRMRIDVLQNPLAYEYFLRSKSYPLSVEGSLLAVEMLKKSIELDSTYAPAYADLGYHKIRLAQHSVGGATSNYQEAEKFYNKALNLNQDQFEALIQLAGYYTDTGNPEQALNLVRKALHINPNSALAQYRLGYVCRYTGLLNEAESAAEQVLRLDPFNLRLGAIGYIYIHLGKYQRALEVREIYKKNLFYHFISGKIYLLLNKKEKALREFNLYIAKEPESLGGLLSKALKNYIEKKYDAGIEAIRKLDKSNPLDSGVLFRISESYALLGAKKDCIRVLRKAVEGGFFCYPFFLTDPFLDSVRDDPEFQEVLALAKEKHEAFKQKYFAE
ncbi:protein kinase, partial [bacterium]|nr:protein kinase [bacterium]